MHDFYSRSAIRSKGLEAVQNLLSDTLQACGKVQNPSETRWLALGKCTVALKNILPSVLVSLGRESEERGDIVATGLYHLMTKVENLAVLHLLCDVLPTVNRLSLQFQESLLDFSRIGQCMNGTVESLKAKKDTPIFDGSFKKLISNLSQQQIEIKIEEDQLTAFHNNVKVPFIDKLVENITERFQSNPVMEAFSHLTDKAYYTTSKQEELNNSVQILASQFGLSHDEAEAEVKDIVHYLIYLQAGTLPSEANLADMLLSSATSAQFPVLSDLAKIYRSLPPHTADCERDFSRMKLIKLK